jgi:hypothetical protein
MFGLTKLVGALNTLAENVLALAGTVAEINGGLRGRLALDGTPAEAAALTHQPAQDGPGGSAPVSGSPPAPRGRRKAQNAA